MPLDVWITILTYLNLSPKRVVEFSTTCKMFKEICNFNYLWYFSYKYTFPVLHSEKSEEENFEWSKINWISEIQKNYLLLSAFKHIVTSMNENKEAGNEHFKEAAKADEGKRAEKYDEAISYYKTALDLAK